MSIPERLLAIAKRMPKEGVFCDVGSDHGLLPLFLLKQSERLCAVVTDIRPSPLERARAVLTEGGVSERADFVLTDGIACLSDRKIDAFVIAGMSGETIARILREGREALRSDTKLYLQPMSHEDLLRAFLYETGITVAEETVVRENGKLFLLLCCVCSGQPRQAPDPVTAALVTYLPRCPGTWGWAYFEEKRRRLATTAEKRRAAGRDTKEQSAILQRIDEILEEMP